MYSFWNRGDAVKSFPKLSYCFPDTRIVRAKTRFGETVGLQVDHNDIFIFRIVHDAAFVAFAFVFLSTQSWWVVRPFSISVSNSNSVLRVFELRRKRYCYMSSIVLWVLTKSNILTLLVVPGWVVAYIEWKGRDGSDLTLLAYFTFSFYEIWNTDRNV